ERAKYPVGKRTEQFAYQIGSWVLGETEILKDTKQGAAQGKEQEDPSQKLELQRIAKALREAMERRRAAAQQGQGESKEQTEEEWWQGATRSERKGWLRAYYAEKSGQLVITLAYV